MTQPGRRAFFKYASPETTLAVLRNRSVRYSSPLAFNDPFDIQSGLHFDFDIDSLPSRVLERLHELAGAPEQPPVDESDVWGRLVMAVRDLYPEHGFDRTRWERVALAPFTQLATIIKTTRQQYQEHWDTKLLPGIRVFCVSEERDNLLMWAHYARDHTGAVFEFWSLPEEDNPLSVAEPIQYLQSPPPFFSEAQFLDDLFSIRKLDFSALYRRYAYCKSDVWAYEREWRVWHPYGPPGEYEAMPVRASEFKGLYLGCRMSDETRRDVIALARTSFPGVPIHAAQKARHAYQLAYTEV